MYKAGFYDNNHTLEPHGIYQKTAQWIILLTQTTMLDCDFKI